MCALIEAEPFDDAELMSKQLTSFLLYSLSASPDSLLPLADELATIEAYMVSKKQFKNQTQSRLEN